MNAPSEYSFTLKTCIKVSTDQKLNKNVVSVQPMSRGGEPSGRS